MGIITRYRATGHHGFTLVELLISISVLGILAGLVIVNLNNSPEQARLARANNELTEIANAAKLYVYNNGMYPPDAGDAGFPSQISKYIAGTNPAGNLPDG